MAKFTVSFNDTNIQTYNFEAGVIRIGRDETNDIQIDSLSIALAHAVLIINNDQCIIKNLNDSFPLFVNNEKTKEHPLADGDKITVGKHIIQYNLDDSDSLAPKSEPEPENSPIFKLNIAEKTEQLAYLQVSTGRHIGRVITLRKAMTKIGQPGDGVVIISKRKGGFFISALESHPGIKVNGTLLGDDTVQMFADDKIEMKKLVMQFFIE